MYAHVTGSVVDSAGSNPPDTALVNGRWYDLRPRTPAILAIAGWYTVTETSRPADTATNTSNLSYTFSGGVVTQVWTVRPKTAQELQQEVEATNATSLTSKASTAITNNITYLGNTTVAAYPGLSNPTTAQTTAQVKALSNQVAALTRQMDATIKIVLGLTADQSGT